MGQADLVQGEPSIVDYTPAVARVAGDIIPVSDNVRIVHVDVASGTLGAYSVGGGIYDVNKPSGVNTTLGDGRNVFWDPAVSGAVSVAGANPYLGQVTIDGGAGVSDTKVRINHLARPA